MVVPPPGLLSTMTVRPVATRKASENTRMVLSVPEPAPNGTTMRNCSSANAGRAARSVAPARTARRVRGIGSGLAGDGAHRAGQHAAGIGGGPGAAPADMAVGPHQHGAVLVDAVKLAPRLLIAQRDRLDLVRLCRLG